MVYMLDPTKLKVRQVAGGRRLRLEVSLLCSSLDCNSCFVGQNFLQPGFEWLGACWGTDRALDRRRGDQSVTTSRRAFITPGLIGL